MLLTVLTDEAVFLLSLMFGEGNAGETTVSFAEFRESHENGLVSFLLGGAGIGRGAAVCGGGGGANGTAGKAPERPVSGFADLGGGTGLISGAAIC